MSIRKNTLILNGPQYDALLAGVRLLAGALGEGMVNPDDGDVGDILTNSGEHPGLTASEVYDLGDAMQAGDLDANELPLLRAIATAALKVDIGEPSKSRLAAFRALGDALVTYNGAPLGFQGRLNPGGAPYPDAARQRDLAAEKPLSEVERLGLTTTPPDWQSGDLRAWTDRFGGIAIHHAGDGSEAYLQPGDEAGDARHDFNAAEAFGDERLFAVLAQYLPEG